jgi:hypothetical protein
MTYLIDYFQERMEAGRANAKRDRDRGGSAVKVFATSAALYRTRAPLTEEDIYNQRLHETHLDCYAAVEFTLFSNEWEGLGS